MHQDFRALTAVLDTVSEAIIWIDERADIIYMNRSALASFNGLGQPGTGVKAAALFPELADPALWAEITAYFRPPAENPHQARILKLRDPRWPAADLSAQTIITRIDAGWQRVYSLQVNSWSNQRVISEEQYLNDLRFHELAEESLRQSREQLARAIDGSGVGLWDWDAVTNRIAINERWAEIIGYTHAELIPVTIDDWNRLTHPDDLQRSYAALEAHFRGEVPFYACEVRMRHKDGSWVWILDRGRVSERDETGKPLRVTGTHLDISDRRSMQDKILYRSQFEDLLMQISSRFINLSENDTDGEINRALREIGEFENVDRSYVFLIDESTDTMSNSHEWCSAGTEPQIENLQNIPNSVLPWWLERMRRHEPITIHLVSEVPTEAAAEKEILEMQGIQSVIVLPMVSHNHLLGFVGFDAVATQREWNSDTVALLTMFSNILSNALQRKANESALRLSEARNAALLNAIPDMMFRIRADGIFLDYAIPNEIELSIPRSRLIGSSIFDMFSKETGNKALASIRSAILSGEKQTFLYELNIPLVGLQHFEARIVANAEDEVVAIVRNISERIHLEQMKSDFINRATHDLRTPLTTILMMVHLMEGENSPEERDQYWAVMKSELNREHDLIEDLLMVGRLESNRWEIKMRPIDPMESLNASIQSLSAQAQAKNLSLSLEYETNTPRIEGDPSALQQVFTNLLNNAIKFTPAEGQISVSVSTSDRKIWFRISDSGIGIPPQDLPNLFSRFFRARNAVDAEVSGSGIGLFIVKSIIEHLGGSISVRSVLNQGTTFEFYLPELDVADIVR